MPQLHTACRMTFCQPATNQSEPAVFPANLNKTHGGGILSYEPVPPSSSQEKVETEFANRLT